MADGNGANTYYTIQMRQCNMFKHSQWDQAAAHTTHRQKTPCTLTTACGRRVAAAMRVMLIELVLLARMAFGCTICAAGHVAR